MPIKRNKNEEQYWWQCLIKKRMPFEKECGQLGTREPPKWLHFMSPQLEWSHFSHPPCTALLIRSLLLLWHLALGSWCSVLGSCFWAKVHGAASSFLDADLNDQFPKMIKMMAPKITLHKTLLWNHIVWLPCAHAWFDNLQIHLVIIWSNKHCTL